MFKNTNENEVCKIMKNLNVCKTCQGSDIPAKIVKLNIDLFSSFICQNFNYCISIGKFVIPCKCYTSPQKKRIKVIKQTIGQ